MSGGSYDYLYCKDCDELFAYSNIRTLEEMESRFLDLGYEDVAKDFRRLIEYIKSANNRVEVLGGQLNEMMHDIEWYDGGDIGADTLAERVEKYRRADTPQTESQNSNKNSNVISVYDGVSEAVRCAMCSNPNKSDRGCDGACSYDEKLYERIMKAIAESVADTPQTEETCERCVYVRGSQWCQGCNGTPKRWDGEKIVDTPQTDADGLRYLQAL